MKMAEPQTIKYYSENQPIFNNCSSNVVAIEQSTTIYSLLLTITENFNNVDGLKVTFQASDSIDFVNYTNLITQTFLKEHLIKEMRSEIKFVPEKFLKYSRLYFEIIGKKPTTGKITAVLNQEEK